MTTFKKKINAVRGSVFKNLAKIVLSSDHQNVDTINKAKVRRVLVVRPNHRLGNQLLMTPVVQEVLDTFPGCTVDLFTGKVSPILFRNYERIERIIRIPRKPFDELLKYIKAWLLLRSKSYDLAINVSRGSSSGRLAMKLSRATCKVFGDPVETLAREHKDYRHIAKYPVYNLRHALSKMGIADANIAIPPLNIKLDAEELASGKKILDSLIENKEAKTICLYTFATGTKCYSEEWWLGFYERLKTQYPQFNIFEILPVENVSMIGFKAPFFYSKDVREMAAIIANAAVFIGADCGVMHLASAAGTPTIGFFSVTDPETYGPYNAGSKALITSQLTQDDIFNAINKVLC